MIKSIAVAVLLAVVSPLQAKPLVPDYKADKVSAHAYVIHGPTELPNKANGGFMNNPVIVETADSLVIIDPGSSVYAGQMVLRVAAKLSAKPVSHVFNSHIHGDHWLGNQAIHKAYPQAEIYAHPKMIEAARAGKAEEWVALMEQLTEGATAGTEAVIPGQALADQQLIEIGGLGFRAHLTDHAHTHTDAMIELVDDGLIVLGDNGFNQRIGRMADASFRGMIGNCQGMLAKSFSVYVPGHGPSGDQGALAPFCQYLEIVYTEAGKAVEDGLADFEIKPKVEALLAQFSDWPGFAEELGPHLSLAMLEYEQASFE